MIQYKYIVTERKQETYSCLLFVWKAMWKIYVFFVNYL